MDQLDGSGDGHRSLQGPGARWRAARSTALLAARRTSGG